MRYVCFNCVDHNKLWKILKEMGIPDHLTCLLRNLYAGQEATVRTGHGKMDWFQIGKAEDIKAVYCHPACLTSMSTEYIMWNAGLDESQAGIKIAGRNINNLRYAHDTTLMAEVEEEQNSPLMEMKEWDSQFLGMLIRSLGSPRRRKGSRALKEEIGVWNSQGGGTKVLFSTFLSKDYITIMYPALGHVCPSWKPSD